MIELFPYQKDGADWLSMQMFALLADEMGLGKSAQAIHACDRLALERILILCPAVARLNWVREFSKFSIFSRKLTAITSRNATLDETFRGCAVLSYDLAPWSGHNLKGVWDLMILDEAHYLKSIEAKRTKAVLGRDGLVRRAKRVWALSGTPTPNHPAELWPLLYTFGHTPLTYHKFVQAFCTTVDTNYGIQITGAKLDTVNVLKRILKPIMLRRKKEDVMKDLPPIHYTDLVVEPGPVELEQDAGFVSYITPNDTRHELMEKLEKENKLIESVVDHVRLGQEGLNTLSAIANSVSSLRRYVGLQKLQPVADLVTEELTDNAYDKIVIFAIHRGVIEGLRDKLKAFRPLTLYGGTPEEKRNSHIDKFQKDPRYRVFIGNIQAAGTAITLTAAHQVLFVEQDWVPGNNAQAAMRCHRIGQTNPVFVRFVGLADSIDERISQILKRKTRDLTAIYENVLPPNVDNATEFKKLIK